MTMTDVVWAETRYESGLYGCKVERDGDHGRLTIHLLGQIDHLLHCETVKCDRADTDKWRTRSLAVISNPDLRSIDR
jgi:hypothetical protein